MAGTVDYSATYTPVDKKLRFRIAHNFTAAVYARLQRAGFKWNAREDLFIAHCTKARTAALLELVPEIITITPAPRIDPAIVALQELAGEREGSA